MEKEIKITPPEGYEIDKENSTFECIKFKPIESKRFIDDENCEIDGYYIRYDSSISRCHNKNTILNHNIFATEKLAKAALAIARLSQIRKYDKRFTQLNFDSNYKYDSNYYYYMTIKKTTNDELELCVAGTVKTYPYMTEIDKLICFNTKEEANLFLEENKELLLDYFTIND